jgi:hypothetical protein
VADQWEPQINNNRKKQKKKAIFVGASARLIKEWNEATNGQLPCNDRSNILRQLEVEYDLDLNALNAHKSLFKACVKLDNPIG